VQLSERYAKYSKLELSSPADGVLQIVLQGHGRAMRWEPKSIAKWPKYGETGRRSRDSGGVRSDGDAFAAGATSIWSKHSARTGKRWPADGRKPRYRSIHIINCSKPSSPRSGRRCGRRLAVALLADISMPAKRQDC